MNRVILMGRLTRDPELTTVGQDVHKATFTVACDRRGHDKNGNKMTDFIPCTAWRQTADFISKYFTKGNRIAVEGSMEISEYTAQDGSKRTFTGVNVYSAEFCESIVQEPKQEPKQEQFVEASDDPDLPFD